MADWAGAYGAGGAADALRQLLTDQLVRQKFAEEQRQAQAREAADAADRQQRYAQMQQMQQQFQGGLDARRDEGYADREQRTLERNQLMQRQQREDEIHTADRQGHAQEVKDRLSADAEQAKLNRQTQLDVVRLAHANSGGGGKERTIKVSYTDPATGQNVEEYLTAEEARQRGKLAPATRGAPGMKEKLADLFETERVAKGILERGGKMKWRGVGPLAGRLSAVGNDVLGNDPEVAALHADIGNVFSLISNQRFGAALTAQELSRATQFLPQRTDPPAVLQQKLNGLIAFAESKRQNMGGLQPAPATASPAAQAPTPGTRRLFNGQEAEWDGQGWLPVSAGVPAGASLMVR